MRLRYKIPLYFGLGFLGFSVLASLIFLEAGRAEDVAGRGEIEFLYLALIVVLAGISHFILLVVVQAKLIRPLRMLKNHLLDMVDGPEIERADAVSDLEELTAKVAGRVRHIEEEAERLREAMDGLCGVVVDLGVDYESNIRKLLGFAGSFLDADIGLYNQISGDRILNVAAYREPAEGVPDDQAEGHICTDLVREQGPTRLRVFHNLQAGPYALSDPGVRDLKLQTYFGYPVRIGGFRAGTLCVLFRNHREIDRTGSTVLEIVASLIGAEEDRREALAGTERLAAFVRDNPSPVIRMGKFGKIEYSNRAAGPLLESWGTTREGMVPFAVSRIAEQVRESGSETAELLVVGDRHYELVFAPNEDGTLVDVFGRDVTEAQEAMREIASRESVSRMLYATVSSQQTGIDEKVVRLLEITADHLQMGCGILSEVVGDTYTVVHVSGDAWAVGVGERFDVADTICARTLDAGKPLGIINLQDGIWRTHPIHEKGEVGAYLGIPVFVDGKVFGTLVFLDETPRERRYQSHEVNFVSLVAEWIGSQLTQSRRQEEIRKLSEVARRTDNGVVITDSEGFIIWVNQSFERMTEYSLDELVGKKPGYFLQGEDTDEETVEEMRESVREHKGFNCEVINYSKSGRKYWVAIEVRPLYGDDGGLINFIAIESDITERKRAEERIEAARQREAEVASRIQETLLLNRAEIRVDRLDIRGRSMPSKTVDGDFFDFIVHGTDCCDVMLGDCMGKGIPAALMGSGLRTTYLRTLAGMLAGAVEARFPEPRSVINAIHAATVPKLIDLDSFITLIYGRFDSRRMRFDYVDLGHTRSMCYRAESRSVETFRGSNLPLGFGRREHYVQHSLGLNAGDIVCLYSDGVTEARSAEGELFGEERLERFLIENSGLSGEELADGLEGVVKAFSNPEVPISDDVTFVLVRVEPEWFGATLGVLDETVAGDFEAVRGLRERVGNFLDEHFGRRLDPGSKGQILLALHEAATNVVQHALADLSERVFEVRIEAGEGGLRVQYRHMGSAFVAGIQKEVIISPDQESGFGIPLIAMIMDEVQHCRGPEGSNLILMTKRIGKGPEL